MDLHLEHLHRCLKITLQNMGSNVSDSSVILAEEAVGVVKNICHSFEKQNSICKVMLIVTHAPHL